MSIGETVSPQKTDVHLYIYFIPFEAQSVCSMFAWVLLNIHRQTDRHTHAHTHTHTHTLTDGLHFSRHNGTISVKWHQAVQGIDHN